MDDVTRAPELAALAGHRTAQLIRSLRDIDADRLRAPSDLEGWSRLTVACHLRYGASALLRMTRDAIGGRPTAYYPEGRAEQQPKTLEPRPGEAVEEVIASFAAIARELDAEWSVLGADDWSLEVVEPPDNPDLGAIPLARLALSRLLEIDVHAADLGIGFSDWTSTLIEVALPIRLAGLATRRTNHREFARTMRGSWMLIASDGPRWYAAVDAEDVVSRPAVEGDEPTAKIHGSSRDLLALLLGRRGLHPLSIDGDAAFGRSFARAFPGP